MGRLNSLPPLGNLISKKGVLAALSKGGAPHVDKVNRTSPEAAGLNALINVLADMGLVESWAPDDLFGNGELGGWWDPSDPTTMFQDTAGTTPVTADGDPVALLQDKSGNGLHLSQATTTACPVYRTNGSLSWLEFDGVDDRLESVASPFGASISEASVLIGTQEITRKAQVLFTLSGNANDLATRWWGMAPFSDGNIYFDAGGAATPYRILGASPYATGTSFLATFESSVAQARQEVRLNGAPFISDPDGAAVATAGTVSLGAAHAGTDFANSKVFGFIARVGTTMSSEERSRAEAWLAARSGITL